MKYVLETLVLSALLCGCLTNSGGRVSGGHEMTSCEPPLEETIKFKKQLESRIEVKFFYDSVTNAWEVWLQESGAEYTDSGQMSKKTWGLDAALVGSEEASRLLAQSLERFKKIHPDAGVNTLFIQMHALEELWTEIHAELRQVLHSARGYRSEEDFDLLGPDGVYEHVLETIEHSAALSTISNTLKKQGWNVTHVRVSSPILFGGQVAGMSWQEIGNIEGAGIAVPGIIEVEIAKAE